MCTWSLKNQVEKIKLDELDFLFISYMIFTASVACKNQARRSVMVMVLFKCLFMLVMVVVDVLFFVMVDVYFFILVDVSVLYIPVGMVF